MLTLLTLPVALAAPPAWPGAESGPGIRVEVAIPPDVLPSGPARVESAEPGGSTRHSLRLPIREDGAKARLWIAYDAGAMGWAGEHEVRIRSEAGPEWSTTLDLQDPSLFAVATPGPQLRGTAEQLAALVAGMEAAGSSRAGLARGGLQLVGREGSPDCRTLAHASYVVADASSQEQELLDCAARGARLILVSPTPSAALSALPPGHLSRWGLGLVAWAPAFDAIAGRAAIELFDAQTTLVPHWGSALARMPEQAPASPLGPAAVLGLLAAYLALIGPVGYLVGVRPRRPLIAWGWFPAVAALATLGAAGVSLAWETTPALSVERSTVIGPDGTGLRTVQVHARTPYGARHRLEAPWEDADISGAWPGHRFGSPLGRPGGPMRILEDAVSGRLVVEGISAGSMGMAPLSWVEPVEEIAGPRLLREGEQLVVENRSPREASGGAVLLDGGLIRLGPMAPGAREVLKLDFEVQLDPNRVYGWVEMLQAQLSTAAVPGSAILALEYKGSSAEDLVVEPEIGVEANEIIVMAGPLPPEPTP